MNEKRISALAFILLLCIAINGFAQTPLSTTEKENIILEYLANNQDKTKKPSCGFEAINNSNHAPCTTCTSLKEGFGTAGWTPESSNNGMNNFDNACLIDPLEFDCSKYRVPLNITVFEDNAWTGANYLGGTGFEPLDDIDIMAKVNQVNDYYQYAEIEFFIVAINRVENQDYYDFNFQEADTDATPFDIGPSASFDVLNSLNLYFVGGFDGDHTGFGTLGFAPTPCSRDYSYMKYSTAIPNVNTTLEHELGHYFGLYHTHSDGIGDNGDASDQPGDNPNNLDCLIDGDGICDTWPTPAMSFGGCSSSCETTTGCFIEGGTACVFDPIAFNCHAVENALPVTNLTISPNDGDPIVPGFVSTVLQQNIMSYNSRQGCREAFSPCQFKKINEVLKECRSYLCARDLSAEFANPDTDRIFEICIGDEAPTFQALSSCYSWYSDIGDAGVRLAGGTQTFTPTIGSNDGELNNMVAGTYTFYLGDANEYNTDCRTELTVVVSPSTGPAEVNVSPCDNSNFDMELSAPSNIMEEGNVVGWWITEGQPVSSIVNNETTLDTEVLAATVNGAIANPLNTILEPNNGIDGLQTNFDCASLDPDVLYYATPVVAFDIESVPDETCTIPMNMFDVTFNGEPGIGSRLDPLDVSCRPDEPLNLPTFTVTVTINGYSGSQNQLAVRFRDESCQQPTLFPIANWTSNGTKTYDETDFPVGYDPGVDGLCVLAFEANGPGMENATLTVSIQVNYEGRPPTFFPGLFNYNACMFGESVEIDCNCGCTINSLVPIDAPDCVAFDTDFYSQEFEVSYSSVPPGATTLEIFGQTFIISSSPQTVIVNNIPTGGIPIIIEAEIVGEDCELTPPLEFITPLKEPFVSNVQVIPPLTCGASDGQIVISPNIMGYEYSINNGLSYQSSNQFSGLLDGSLYSVWVNNNGSCPVNTGEFGTISANSTFVADIINPEITGCDNEVLEVFVETNANDPSTLTYSWFLVGDPSNILGTDNPFIPTMSGNYQVIVDDNGCTDNATVIVVLTSSPDVMFNDTISCENEGIFLETNAPIGSLYTYDWTFSFDTDSTLTTFSGIDAFNVGEYYVEVTDALGGGCTTFDTVKVDHIPVPTATLASDTIGCGVDQLDLDANVGFDPELFPNISYEWLDQNLLVVGNDPILNVTTQQTYYVNITTQEGCVVQKEIFVEFIDQPEIFIGIDSTLCLSSPPNPATDFLNIIAFVNTNAFEIEWTLSSNPSLVDDSGPNDNLLPIYEGGTLTATIGNPGCMASDEMEIFAAQRPDVNLVLNEPFPCQGDAQDIFISNTFSNLQYEYEWRNEFGQIISNDNPFYPGPAAQTYDVLVTDNGTGCTTLDSFEMSFADSYPVDIAIPDTSLCEGDNLQITFSALGGNSAWLFGEDLNSISFAEIGQVIEFMGEGYYVAENIHEETNCIEYDTIFINTIPAPNVDLGPETQFGCLGEPYILETDSESGVTYQWYKDGAGSGILNGETNSTITLTEEGNYSLVADNGTCTTTKEVSLQIVDFFFNINDGVDTLFACETINGGVSLTFTEDPASTGSFPGSFSWTYENDPTIIGTTITQFATEPGTYYLTAEDQNADCVHTDSIVIAFSDPPDISLGQDTTICTTDEFAFNTGIDGYTHIWYIDSEPQLGISGNQFTLDANDLIGTFTEVSVEIYLNDPDCTSAASITISLANAPQVIWEDSLFICSGEDIRINAISEKGNYSYQWYFENEEIIGEEDDFYETNFGGDYYVIVGAGECKDTFFTVVNTGSVDALDLGDDQILCPGNDIILDGTGDYENYFWINGSNSGSQDPTVSLSADGSIEGEVEYILQVTNEGCTDQDTINVYFSTPITDITVFPDSPEICFGDSIQLEVIGGGPNFEWDNSITLTADNISNPIAVPYENVTYTVRVYDDCPGNEGIGTIDVVVFPEAEYGIMEDSCVIEGLPFSLFAFGGNEYLWDNATSILGSNTIGNPMASITDSTRFNVVITDVNGCTYEEYVDICVLQNPEDLVQGVTIITPNDDGINDQLIFDGLEAFPNSKLVIFNRWGNIVYEQDGYQLNGELWDGTSGGDRLPADTYYYILTFADFTIKNTITITREN